MRVYLAGPMTGLPQFNFPAFDNAEKDLQARGYDVVPPADLHDPVVREQALASTDGALNVARLCGLPIYEYGPTDPLTQIEREALAHVFGAVA